MGAADSAFHAGNLSLKNPGGVRLTCVVAKADERHTPTEQMEPVVKSVQTVTVSVKLRLAPWNRFVPVCAPGMKPIGKAMAKKGSDKNLADSAIDLFR